MLEWISIYWFSRAGPAASSRIYYEMTAGGTRDTNAGTKWMPVPVGVSYFARELLQLPKSCACPRSVCFAAADARDVSSGGRTWWESSCSRPTMTRAAILLR